MAWTATATVTSVSDTAVPPVTAVLTASGSDIMNTGDDLVSAITLSVQTEANHLTVGSKVTITAEC